MILTLDYSQSSAHCTVCLPRAPLILPIYSRASCTKVYPKHAPPARSVLLIIVLIIMIPYYFRPSAYVARRNCPICQTCHSQTLVPHHAHSKPKNIFALAPSVSVSDPLPLVLRCAAPLPALVRHSCPIALRIDYGQMAADRSSRSACNIRPAT